MSLELVFREVQGFKVLYEKVSKCIINLTFSKKLQTTRNWCVVTKIVCKRYLLFLRKILKIKTDFQERALKLLVLLNTLISEKNYTDFFFETVLRQFYPLKSRQK